MEFCNFLYFFAIFLVFCFTSREGTHRKGFFYFLSFPPFRNLFWLEKNAIKVFSNFLNFFAIFLEFSITVREGTHRKDFFYFLSFSPFPNLFWLEKNAIKVFSNFLNFFAFFFRIFYYGSGRNTSEKFFHFSLSLGLSHPILA